MTEIPFIAKLGDALEAAIVEAPVQARRRRLRRPRPRVAVLLAALVLGGVATAATLLRQPTQLAAESISCIYGTGSGAADGAYDIPTLGRTPQQACSGVVHRPAGDLVACDGGRSGIVVYYSDGRTGQCERLRDRALPTGYGAADAQVARLVAALQRLYDSRNCMTPAALAAGSDAILRRLGFTGWRAQLELSGPLASAGPCGTFPASGSSFSDASSAIDPHGYPAGGHRLVMINDGPSRSTDRAIANGNRLLAASGRRCYSLAGAQRLVRRALPAVPVEFAAVAEQRGAQMALARRQAFYDRGCTVVVSVGSAPDGRAIEVILSNRRAPRAVPGRLLAPGVFQPVLRRR